MPIAICAVLLVVLSNAIAAPAPMVRVEVAAPQPIRVGQQVSVDVTVLAPNFFMSAPAFPTLDVPGAIVTLPDARALNGTQSIDGVTFATISKSYAFVAGQDGDFDLPQATISLTYAGNDGAPQQATVTLPATRIRVGAGGVPKDASSGAPSGGAMLPVAQLNVTQTLAPAPDHDVVQLKVGDTLVRTVATFAPGTQAMLIRPPKLDAPRRVRVFAADPKLSDGVSPNSGSSATGGLRIDTFSYVFERKGTYTLPVITLDWTDPATGRASHSDAPAIRVVVATGAAAGELTPGTAWLNLSQDAESIGVVLASVAGLAVLGLVIWRTHSRWHTVRRRHDERLKRVRQNAKSLHAEVIQACRAGDAIAAYRLAQRWSEDVTGLGLAAWAQTTQDVPLIDAVSTLERRLFSPADDAAAKPVWDGGPLATAFNRCAAIAITPVHRTGPSFLAPLNTF
ncbi:BatD family protein [Pandoraea sp. PE-S2R-1]|uniref:BatD family protein n=1 Tax=Pandoraea sp. PE-S2R-1 TaxID=1986994 RepID=UPI001482B995|nr:BatD family protein [Pandoraea sp. PE-S2R-1]